MNAIRFTVPARLLLVPFLLATCARPSLARGPVVSHDTDAAAALPRTTFACPFAPGPLDPTTAYAAGDGWNWIAWHIPQQPCGNCPAPRLVAG